MSDRLLEIAWLGAAVAFVACDSTATPSEATVDGGGTADSSVPDGASSAGDASSTNDGALHDAAESDATIEASADGGQCAVKMQCTNNNTLNIPPEISGQLDPSCAASQQGATLQERCSAFCKEKNSGFASMTTCTVSAGETTFQCRCVNP
jgi:hypothetical protein